MEDLELDPLLFSLEEMIVNNQWNDIFSVDNEEDLSDEDTLFF